MPLIGRFYTQQEDDQKETVAVFSYPLWQSRFHGDPQVIGHKILLYRKPFVVVGFMPRNFEFPLAPGHLNRSELWVPMSFTQQEWGPAGAASWSYNMVGRLKPEVTSEQAQNDSRAQIPSENVCEEAPRKCRLPG